jgi:hypothetical protein
MNLRLFAVVVMIAIAGLMGAPHSAAQVPSARSVAKEAFIYGFPVVAGYETLYKQSVDRSGPNFVAPFNTIGHSSRVATPQDKQFVTPNSDTPYSYIWMDLRAEPLVITMPKIDKGRYYSAQLIDLYTHNFGYLGTRNHGNAGGDFLITGPDWKGEKPKGIKAIISSETQLAYALIRTQLFNPADLKNVLAIQARYKVRTLSQYLGTRPPATAVSIDWPKPMEGMTTSSAMFPYLNFLLQFCPPHPSETGMLQRFATLGIGAGRTFDFAKLGSEGAKAVDEGIAQARQDEADMRERMQAGEVSATDLFGDRAFLNGQYLRRFIAADLGIYGNSKEEALYPNYFIDSTGKPLDASGNRYTLRFEKGQLPPAGAFWSLTMYDGKTRTLVENRLKRYLINSTMTKSFKYGADGSLTLYLQKDSPGAGLEANWLPAPGGPFYNVLRIYLPKAEVLDGRWKPPSMVREGVGQMTGAALETTDTSIGRLEFERGYPSQPTVKLLFDQMDMQRASQTYLWALPLMGFAKWQQQHEQVFGAKDTDLVVYNSYRDKLGLLTANATTPYILGFPNLARTGPLVVEIPAGPTAGGISDFWQIGNDNGEFGEAGPDKAQGDKILLLGPGEEDPQVEGYRVVRSRTVNAFIGFRVLSPDPQVSKMLLEKFRIYPLSQRAAPPVTRYISPDGKPWSGTQPRGIAYWELLAATIDQEPVREKDRVMMAMLKPLGIEKGKPFKPNARQIRLLTEGAFIGEAMARANAYQKRFPDAAVWPDRRWEISLGFDPGQEPAYHAPLDEHASWFYEAVTAARAMATKVPGVGQTYLEATKDKDGNWLNGGATYRLRVSANVPAKQFWSVTVYDNETRCFIENKEEIADRSSRMDLIKNLDGSVDIYFGPTAPKGKEQNWIPTLPGKGWFAYFRLYAPTESYFDRSWKLADIERVN